MTECIFCRVARREIPGAIVHQDQEITAFRDIQPRAPVHILLVPNRHIPSAAEMQASEGPLLARLFQVANGLAAQEGIAERGYRLVVNCGPEAGQSVPHFHMHLLGGRELLWPPG